MVCNQQRAIQQAHPQNMRPRPFLPSPNQAHLGQRPRELRRKSDGAEPNLAHFLSNFNGKLTAAAQFFPHEKKKSEYFRSRALLLVSQFNEKITEFSVKTPFTICAYFV